MKRRPTEPWGSKPSHRFHQAFLAATVATFRTLAAESPDGKLDAVEALVGMLVFLENFSEKMGRSPQSLLCWLALTFAEDEAPELLMRALREAQRTIAANESAGGLPS